MRGASCSQGCGCVVPLEAALPHLPRPLRQWEMLGLRSPQRAPGAHLHSPPTWGSDLGFHFLRGRFLPNPELSHLLAGRRAEPSGPLLTGVQLSEGPHFVQGLLFQPSSVPQASSTASVLRDISASVARSSLPPGCRNVSMYHYGSSYVAFLIVCHFPFVLESAACHHTCNIM